MTSATRLQAPSSTRTGVATLLLALAPGLGCASYPERTSRAYSDFQRGQLDAAYRAYADTETTGSEFLSGAEAGLVALTEGRWNEAQQQLDRALAVSQDADREALASAENLQEFLLTWTVGESLQRYVGEGYERVLLHSASALSRLARGDLEGARVETRLANQLLEAEESLYEKEYGAGGLGHFLSAVVYELDGKPDEAYIDYARMEAKGVGVALASQALPRLARSQGRSAAYAEWIEKYGEVELPPEDSASVVVIAGVGEGPYKQENTLAVPTLDGIFQWSVPSFVSRPQTVGDLELSVAGATNAVRTVVVENVSSVASENLQDRLLMLSAKSAVRGFLKLALQEEVNDEHGMWAMLAVMLFTVATERADLRSWQTLPDTWQAARAFVPPGRRTLALEARGGERVELGTFELAPRETLFILARSLGPRLYAHVVGGLPVEVEPGPDEGVPQP